MKNVNIRALARELKLSLSTVSKALRDSYEISAATKERVRALAAEWNYIPNAYASSLRGRKSKNIAVVLPEVADSFFSIAINGIEAAVKPKGYHVIIYLTHESYDGEAAILKDFQSGRVDGVLLSVSRETTRTDHVQELMDKEVPVVFFDRVLETLAAPKVVTDDAESAYKATTHLLSQGCREIAYLGISEDLYICRQRMEGYRQALRDHQLPVQPRNILTCAADATRNFQLVKKLLQRANRPDGIVASVEKLTTTVYQVCQQLQLHMPGDVKLVCFSNLEIATILQPSLTTITQPAFEMGKTAAEMLVKILEKKVLTEKDIRVVIPSELVVRGSSGVK
ncbi:LacI family DNA-binding transcriptional regulator [Chitinophaga qingshengii]|uniref:LacI family DNA-binding transcriptional regulator n=1 Tax=Chitinophaga qingshengii TaxID=1569794 RepID=A0ABR7TL47_9BACT|nr:LacI family DNA-binding transcriptional regulator [Chitinophaga qingshengii]MBC9931216.1 LacI family DNA-binding transcriptional regulator [Chitinophaga qingshengii]